MFRRLALGLSLIAAAAAVLLYADLDNRTGAAVSRPRRIALFQHVSTTVLDDGVKGIIAGLADRGFVEGDSFQIQRFNANGDMATGSSIARQVTAGGYDVVVTVSTPSMQAVAKNNVDGRVTHIFSVVSDPFSAGIGLDRNDPMRHPPYMTGQSSFMPVDETFQMARAMFPALQRVGVAWNPAESNSEAFVKSARAATNTLGLTLLEASLDSSAALGESVQSLISRGAEVIWVGGDNTVMAAIDSVIATAKRARIPVVTITPGKPDRGTLLDVGFDFVDIGRLSGHLVADILDGADPATIPVRDIQDVARRRVTVNRTALRGLRQDWSIPESVLAKATTIVDDTGIHEKTTATPTRPLSKQWKVDFIQYVNSAETEEAEAGAREGLRDAGLVEGRDYVLRIRNAQGDMANLTGMVDAAISDGANLLLTFSTPTLQAAMRRTSTVPIVFTLLANAVAAGVGPSDTEHKSNVTGVYLMGAYDEVLDVVHQVVPNARRLGTLYVPAEVNTVFHRDRFLAAATKRGYTVKVVAANTSSEVADAALALVSSDVQVITQLPGNLTSVAFPMIAQAARRARLPVFSFMTSQAATGAVAAVSRDYHDGGHESALVAARIMRGESAASIPLEAAKTTRLTVNPAAARELRLTIPPALLSKAEVLQPVAAPATR